MANRKLINPFYGFISVGEYIKSFYGIPVITTSEEILNGKENYRGS